MFHNYKGKVVLITGGVKGIGLHAGLSFAQEEAHARKRFGCMARHCSYF
jgi:NAD(P)-dependent dehydrogenase (short-subunit alcohol dehydrogenase family)